MKQPVYSVFSLVFFLFSTITAAHAAPLKVLTTISDLNALVSEIGQDLVNTEAFCKGTQDPHFLEPKPSYILKANAADLVIAIGLGLEVGWLPGVIQGARNPKIASGQLGYLEVGAVVTPLEVPTGKVTRAEGDVHPEGNPHVTLDPVRTGEIAVAIGMRLGQLDPAHSTIYGQRAHALQQRLLSKVPDWQARIDTSGVKAVVTYHKTLTYFLHRFKIANPAILEPLPGVPPTARHGLAVMELIKREKVPLILVENFFQTAPADRIAADVPGLRVTSVAVAVGGDQETVTIDSVYENLVKKISSAGK